MREVRKLKCPYCERAREHDISSENPVEKVDCTGCGAVATLRVIIANGRVVMRAIEWEPGRVVALPADPQARTDVINFLARRTVEGHRK